MPMVVIKFIIVALVEAGVGLGIAIIISFVAVSAVIVAGASAYSSAQSRKLRNALRGAVDTARALTIKEAASSRKVIYGQVRVGGTLVYIATSGTGNEYLHMVVAHAGHECEEIGDVYLNDALVPLDGSGNATGTFAGFLTVKKHLGSDSQTVDTDLQTAVGSGEWTNNHRLRGICYSYVRMKHNPDLFTSGIPNYSVMLKGKKVYDPRSTLTAYSANAALCIRDYLMDTTLGLGATSDEMDDAAVITAANICDESVNLNPSGSEARYELHGLIDTATEPGAVLDDMLGAMAGICPYIGGKFVLIAGAHTSSVQTLTLDDARGAIKMVTGDSLRDCFNGVKGVFISEANNWQPADFPPVVNSTYTTEDGGRIWRDVALPFTISTAAAQRMAKIELERGRQDITVEFPAKLTALNVRVGDVISLTIPRYAWTAKLFEVVEWSFATDTSGESPTLGINLVLRSTASSVWDWSYTEETQVADSVSPTLADPTAVTAPSGVSLSTSNVVQRDGTISPRLQVQWTQSSNDLVKRGGLVRLEYKKAADSDFIDWGVLDGSQTKDFITDVQTGVSYDVRLRFENIRGVRSAYSTTATYTVTNDTTAPATPTGLTATAGPGCVILDWDDNTENDLDRYELYRATTNSFGASALVWTGYASQHSDFFGVTSGVTYYYFLKALDTSDNPSTVTASVNAAPLEGLGGFTDNVFKRAATIPSTPTGDTPAGWSDAPPAADGNPLWLSVADKTAAGVLVGAWSTPVQLEGSGLVIEYSVDGSTSWHSTFTGGDLYARQTVFGGTPSAAFRIVGETGATGATGATGSVALYATLSEIAVDASGSNGVSITTPSVTCLAVGGTAPYTYSWTRTSGTGTATASTSKTTAFTNSGTDQEKFGTWKCAVTDSAGSPASVDSDSVDASWYIGTPP